MANEEAEFKELPKAENEDGKFKKSIGFIGYAKDPKFSIYNNRFYRHLYLSEEIAEKKQVESRGCQVVDETKNNNWIASNAKFNFWVLISVGVLIIYSLIKHWMR